MSLVLGIDTGGTYTDGVVFDRVERQLLAKAKSRTTREDLSIGITRVIEAVEEANKTGVSGVAMLDGGMVGPPMFKRARTIMKQIELAGK